WCPRQARVEHRRARRRSDDAESCRVIEVALIPEAAGLLVVSRPRRGATARPRNAAIFSRSGCRLFPPPASVEEAVTRARTSSTSQLRPYPTRNPDRPPG